MNKRRTRLAGLKVLNLTYVLQLIVFSLLLFLVASGGFEPPVSGL